LLESRRSQCYSAHRPEPSVDPVHEGFVVDKAAIG